MAWGLCRVRSWEVGLGGFGLHRRIGTFSCCIGDGECGSEVLFVGVSYLILGAS